MPLENYNLDDITFQDLVEEAKSKVSKFSQKWTNHNISDPGITLIDLFAWITEIYSYSINKIPEKNYLKFLKLIGIFPIDYTLPQLDLKIQAETNNQVNYHHLKQGCTFYSDTLKIKVTTSDDLDFAGNLNIQWIFSSSDSDSNFQETSKSFNETRYSNSQFQNSYLFPFGRNPQSGNGFFIGLRVNKKDFSNIENIEMPNFLSILFHIYNHYSTYFSEQKNSKISKDLSIKNILKLDDLTRELTWEYADKIENKNNISGDNSNDYQIEWKLLNFSKDTTNGFTKNGQVILKFPFENTYTYTNIFKDKPGYLGKDYNAFWIRCKLKSSKYQNPPRVSNVLLNTVPAVYSNSMIAYPLNMGVHLPETNQEYSSNGLPNQKFELIDKNKLPIIKINYLKTGQDPKNTNTWTNWTEVDDFYSSQFSDTHYVIDKNLGIITFGDGVHGDIPIKGHRIIIEYVFGDIDNMIIKQDSIFVYKNETSSFTGTSILDSTRGIKKETLNNAIIRAREEIKIPSRAVSASDYEYIAKNTPTVSVVRTKAYSSGEVDNVVNVIVVPYSENSKAPIPNDYFLNCVNKHLDKYRLITTKIKVIPPYYKRISIDCHLVIHSNANEINVRKKVLDLIYQNFRIIPQNDDNDDYAMRDFGKDVYNSEISSIVKSLTEIYKIKSINLYDSETKRSCEKILVSDMGLVVVDEISVSLEKYTIKRKYIS